MRRHDIRFRPEALADLDALFLWLLGLGADEATAERFVRRLTDRCVRIGDAARAGRPRDDLAPGLRTVAFERRAVIAYVVRADAVEIVSVFHRGRDLDGFYRDGSFPTEDEDSSP